VSVSVAVAGDCKWRCVEEEHKLAVVAGAAAGVRYTAGAVTENRLRTAMPIPWRETAARRGMTMW